jgi:hypothetical protein
MAAAPPDPGRSRRGRPRLTAGSTHRTAAAGSETLPAGPVRLSDLEAIHVRLLEVICAGETVVRAAERCFLSLRTAHRHLGRARLLLRVATTREAVRVYRDLKASAPAVTDGR